jgi:hypothetical protein
MKIPNKLLDNWEKLKSSNDASCIAEVSGYSRQSVYRAFDMGECSDELFEAMATFYKEKQERIESFLSDYQD